MKDHHKILIAGAIVIAAVIFWPSIRNFLGMNAKPGPAATPGAGSDSKFTETTGHPPSVPAKTFAPFGIRLSATTQPSLRNML